MGGAPKNPKEELPGVEVTFQSCELMFLPTEVGISKIILNFGKKLLPTNLFLTLSDMVKPYYRRSLYGVNWFEGRFLLNPPMFMADQKFLKFDLKGKLYKFICMLMGYSPSMRIFTKVLKPPFAYLRSSSFDSCCLCQW